MPDTSSRGSAHPPPQREGVARTRAAYRKVSWRLIPFLGLCYLTAYLDRINVGFAKLQMSGDLHFSETVYGLGAGIFFIGYFLFEVPSNLLLHRVGARLWIARIMVSWGLLSMAMMTVDSVAMFYAMRFLLGVAEAGFFPGIILYLTYWYPAHRRGHITALFMSAVALSGVIGGPVSGWILETMSGVRGWAGWQWLFLIEGLPAVLLGVAVLFYLPDRIGDAKWLDEEERRLLQANIDAEDQRKRAAPVLAVLRGARTWHLGAIYFCLVAGLYGVAFWLPTLIRNTGIDDLLHIGFLNALPYAVAVIGMILISRSADARRERRWHVAIPAALGALGLALTTWWSHDSVDRHRGIEPRDAGHPLRPAAVLEPAHRLPDRHGRRRRHRPDQLHRQPGRLRQPLPGRLAEGRDAQLRGRDHGAGRAAAAGRLADPEDTGQCDPMRRQPGRDDDLTLIGMGLSP
jgi:MFS family permease